MEYRHTEWKWQSVWVSQPVIGWCWQSLTDRLRQWMSNTNSNTEWLTLTNVSESLTESPSHCLSQVRHSVEWLWVCDWLADSHSQSHWLGIGTEYWLIDWRTWTELWHWRLGDWLWHDDDSHSIEFSNDSVSHWVMIHRWNSNWG